MIKVIALIVLSSLSTVSCRAINAAGLALIEEFEGFRANFYTDSAIPGEFLGSKGCYNTETLKGHKTIGYGHNCDAHTDCGTMSTPLTQAQGVALLQKDLVTFENCVNAQAPSVNDNQFAALVSFSFNLGCGSFESSTLLKDIKAGDIAAASKQFGLWVNAGGVKLEGLVRRREAERVLFCTGGVC